ncbi:hypothetical protein [Paraburkholderia tropica]|uniref:hypothetical protein n=1 Tax=Paraburkholderia tropica TaxID=92647 RepID=UPI0007ED47ED|nr:hypothetical protein [Paraburkholderia tropica]OBR54138.1 hypothetical protein A6456_37725 [Paraburkholderia tropica]
MLTDKEIWEMAGPCWTSPQCFTVLVFARAIEQASRAEALEECACLCDQLWTRAGDADQCADAIRILAKTEGESK